VSHPVGWELKALGTRPRPIDNINIGMRSIEFTSEARRNPELNPRVDSYTQLKTIAAQYGRKNMFVRFSNDEKFGVNPKPGYSSTPLGIYGYPLKYVLQMGLKNIPYQGDAPYIWVFQYLGSAATTIDNGKQSLNPKLAKSLINSIGQELEAKGVIEYDPTSILETLRDNAYDDGEIPPKENSVKFIMTLLSGWYSYENAEGESIDLNQIEQYRALKRAGVTAVIDSRGSGDIHINESTQAVFFDIKQLKVVKLIQTWKFHPKGRQDAERAFIRKLGYVDIPRADKVLTAALRFGKRKPEDEREILKSPLTVYRYATEVLKKPWPQGESVIQNTELWPKYQNFFNLNQG
jgi:hypothetical protein